MTRRLRTQLAIGAALAVSALAAGCGGEDESAAAGEAKQVRILVSAPLTGDYAESGRDMVDGAELAAEYLNENGGVASGPLEGAKFKIESADDELSTKAATTIASKYVQDEGIFALTGFADSALAQAAAVVAQRARLGVVSAFAGADYLTDKADNIAVVPLGNDRLGRVALDYVHSELGAQTVGTIAGDFSFLDSYYEGMAEETKELGMEWVSKQSYPAGTSDFSSLITNLEAKHPDVVLGGAFMADAGRIASQVRRAGFDVPYVDFLGEGWGESYFDSAGNAAEGTVGMYAGDVFAPEDTFAGEIAARFREVYGKRIPAAAQHAFDSVLTIAAAIDAGAGTREQLIESIGKAKGEGTLGPIAFGDDLRPLERTVTLVESAGNTVEDQKPLAAYQVTPDELERTR